jgi:hypothetical protein
MKLPMVFLLVATLVAGCSKHTASTDASTREITPPAAKTIEYPTLVIDEQQQIRGSNTPTAYHLHAPVITWTPEEAYEHLIKVRCFAFGGVGRAGQTSTGEVAFRAILRSDKGAELFKSAISEGSEEAKLYSLCGIRLLDRTSFAASAQPLSKGDSEVTTMSGCIGGHETVGAVVRQIADGVYDPYLKQIRR